MIALWKLDMLQKMVNLSDKCITPMFNQKLHILTLAIGIVLASSLPAQSGPVRDKVNCYFFRGDSLELRNTCKIEDATWAGGGNLKLYWPDGVVTVRQWQNGPSRVSPTAHSWIDGENVLLMSAV